MPINYRNSLIVVLTYVLPIFAGLYLKIAFTGVLFAPMVVTIIIISTNDKVDAFWPSVVGIIMGVILAVVLLITASSSYLWGAAAVFVIWLFLFIMEWINS